MTGNLWHYEGNYLPGVSFQCPEGACAERTSARERACTFLIPCKIRK
jgi:hypothetical protein